MAEEMMANFSGSGHSMFRASRGKKSPHFNGSHKNIELLLRTVISANQLSMYGAIAELCDEVPKGIRAPGKPAAPDHLAKMDALTDPLCGRKFYQCTATEKPSAIVPAKFEQLSGE